MTAEVRVDDVRSDVLWPFLIAPKPPDGFSTVLVPAFLDGVDLRGLVADDDPPTTTGPRVTLASAQNTNLWLVYLVVHHARDELPPVGSGHRSSSTRPVTVIEGCVVRSADRPTPAMVREATSPEALRVYESEFLRFWTSDEPPGAPRPCPPLMECVAAPSPPTAPVPAVVHPAISPGPEVGSRVRTPASGRRYVVAGIAVLVLVVAVAAIVWLAAGA
jgi:hypothetical protein